MGSTKNVDMSANTDEIKKVSAPADEAVEETPEEGKSSAPKAPKRARSYKYRAVRAKLDKTRVYSIENAVELVKELSYSNFEGTISAAVVVKELGRVGSVTFPHQTGKARNIVIVDDKVLAKIEANDIDDIDVLIADPQYMPKLAKYGRVLGPKGLMPNPKAGTLTPNPEEKKKELEAGKIMLQTQKKQPVIHILVGKEKMETDKIVDNVRALLSSLGTKVVKLSLAATMSPGVRVDVSEYKKKAEK